MNEPLIHSHIKDELPESHPFANEDVICGNCSKLLHAGNNECMTTWIEAGNGNFCLKCFSTTQNEVLEENSSLKGHSFCPNCLDECDYCA